ncbi:MAG: hypothetical protein M1818_003378 [Claussenomyces sp. TS43310]|nr:MAG: hypothetical protein M1818_003378 [Claussenomyces sp. TS43310]
MGSVELPMASGTQGRQSQRRIKLPTYLLSLFLVLLYVQLYLIPRLLFVPTPSSLALSQFHADQLTAGLQRCAEARRPKVRYSPPVSASRSNPRWNPISGQNGSVLLHNARLFNGETILKDAVDIRFSRGIIESVETTSRVLPQGKDGLVVINLEGNYVTPGLVDMHSHHLVESWPATRSSSDGNEEHADFGPLTPFVRSLDSMKSYDPATAVIASGGITTSLILPGSANIMGGEGFLIKNYNNGGEDGEEVVEDMLLEHGIPHGERRRFMKMACGENPRSAYAHTRMGNAWKLRQHMAKAQELLEKQDSWCLSAAAAQESGEFAAIVSLAATAADSGTSAQMLEMDSTIGMLRGKVGVNVHCYEPEDFEDMLLHSHEFGFRIQAFHHALSAWKVPEMIKDRGDNITIATFADFALYKVEAYEANLWAGKVLSDHGVPVAYKSDHVMAETNAKYLIYQAAIAHSFHLPEDLALQSVTSVPAKSLEIDHRVGYIMPGYDADIVVWNTHPLAVGATPLQVYIDGKPTLDPEKVKRTVSKMRSESYPTNPQGRMRRVVTERTKSEICKTSILESDEVVITGIRRNFLRGLPSESSSDDGLTMVLNAGKLTCLGTKEDCIPAKSGTTFIALENGYVAPGLIAISNALGLGDIANSDDTSDGIVSAERDVLDPRQVEYAKYGIHLEGKAFKRAQYGGVTKAITSPMAVGFLSGVSVGIKTNGKSSVLDGGIFQDDVALHLAIGQIDKESKSTPTISAAVKALRKILFENRGKDNVYGKAANGTLPVVLHVENKYDILEMIKLKKDHGDVNMIIYGGSGAPAVAEELASSKIPVILAPFRCAQDTWENLDCPAGPPLTKSSAEILSDAGVIFGIAIGGEEGDPHLQNLMLEASWAAKYAGLSDQSAVDLVSTNIEKILGLKTEGLGDFVVYEGNPLEFGAAVVLSVDGGDGGIVNCFPDVQ